MTMYQLNQELNGVEIYFNNKPITDIINQLKENKFRWNGSKKCWYAKQSNNTLALAETITNNNLTITDEEAQQLTIKTNKKLSLYDRLQFKEGNTDKSEYNYNFVGSNYTGLDTKSTAKEIRSILKKLFPEVKFSITSDYHKINVSIKESPYNYETLEYNFELTNRDYQEFNNEHNKELIEIMKYCNRLLESFNYDDSDSMSDYFNTHFYKNVSIDYDYIQIEQSEEIKNDITAFRNQLKVDAEAEEVKKELEYQERLKQQEIRKQQQVIIDKRIKEEEIYINENVNIKELEENNQYFVIGSQFANMNKNNTLAEYQEEIEIGKFTLENVKITREIHFNDNKALEYFNTKFLHDFDFLEGTGGSYTDDKRINSMIDYDNMTPEERKTVQFNLLGVAVYLDNKLEYIIDTQGFKYARYIGLVDNVTITKDYIYNQAITDQDVELLKIKADTITNISTTIIDNDNLINTWNTESWKQYKELMKLELKEYNIRLTKAIIQQIPEDLAQLKISMYKLLIEVDGMQEQFKNADIQEGQKLTIFKISDFGMMLTSKIIFDSVTNTTYAQYNDVVKLTFIPEGKKKLYYNHFYNDMLVYEGWLDIPKSVLYDIEDRNGFISTKTKYLSCDKQQYDEILEYFNNQDIKPIVNTYKPLF